MQDSGTDRCDCRPELASLQRAVDTGALAHAAISQRRQVIAQHRSDLETKIDKAQAELRQERRSMQEIESRVLLGREEYSRETKALQTLWPQIEEASAELQEAHTRMAAVREQAHELDSEQQERQEAASCLYELYSAATGIRWDGDSTGEEGYIALGGTVRPFYMQGASMMAAADAVWEEIEACLPQPREQLSMETEAALRPSLS